MLGFVVRAAVVGQTFRIFVLENLREFGALKAMGAANGAILTRGAGAGTAVGVVGFAIGIGMAAAFFEITSRSNVGLRCSFLVGRVAASVAVALIGSVAPAVGETPVMSLRGECRG